MIMLFAEKQEIILEVWLFLIFHFCQVVSAPVDHMTQNHMDLAIETGQETFTLQVLNPN